MSMVRSRYPSHHQHRAKKGLFVVKDAEENVIDSADRIDSATKRADKAGVPCKVVHVLSGKVVRPFR